MIIGLVNQKGRHKLNRESERIPRPDSSGLRG